MAGEQDLVFPGIPDLRAARTDLSPLIRSTEQQQRSTDELLSGISRAAQGLGNLIQPFAEAQALGDAQTDLLHAKMALTDAAGNLIANRKYAFDEVNDFDPEAGGGELPRGKQYAFNLDPSFRQTIDTIQQNLIQKYSRFPRVLDSVLSKFDDTAAEAYKGAHVQAMDQVKSDAMASIKTNGTLFVQASAADGKYDKVDAYLNSDAVKPFLSEDAKATLRDELRHKIDVAHTDWAADQALKTDGLGSAVTEIDANSNALSGQERMAALGKLEKANAVADKSAADLVTQARKGVADQVSKGADYGRALIAAADNLDSSPFPYKANLRAQTDLMRVEGELQPALYMIQAGNASGAQQLSDQMGKDNGWSPAQVKHANDFLKNYQGDWDRIDKGTGGSILEWGSEQVPGIVNKTVSAQATIDTLIDKIRDYKAKGVYGAQAAKDAMSVMGNIERIMSAEGWSEPKVPDPATVVSFMDRIRGQNLTSDQIAQVRRDLGKAYFQDKRLTYGAYTTLEEFLTTPYSLAVSKGMDALSQLDAGNPQAYAQDAMDFAASVRGLNTMDSKEITQRLQSVHDARVSQNATKSMNSLFAQSAVGNLWRAVTRQPSLEQAGVLQGDIAKSFDLVNNGSLKQLVEDPKNPATRDAQALTAHLRDLAAADYAKRFGQPAKRIDQFIPSADGSKYGLMAFIDGKGNAVIPVVSDGKLTWQTVTK